MAGRPQEAVTTHGTVRLADYEGNWLVLFSHPADWRPGDAVIVPAPVTTEQAAERVADGYECTDWYLCTKKV